MGGEALALDARTAAVDLAAGDGHLVVVEIGHDLEATSQGGHVPVDRIDFQLADLALLQLADPRLADPVRAASSAWVTPACSLSTDKRKPTM